MLLKEFSREKTSTGPLLMAVFYLSFKQLQLQEQFSSQMLNFTSHLFVINACTLMTERHEKTSNIEEAKLMASKAIPCYM
jgi:hypothetical protein